MSDEHRPDYELEPNELAAEAIKRVWQEYNLPVGPTMFRKMADAALSATPIEALQQRVERLEVAGRTLQGYIEGRPQDPFYEVKYRPAEIDAALRVFRPRAALGDDVG